MIKFYTLKYLKKFSNQKFIIIEKIIQYNNILIQYYQLIMILREFYI